MKESFHSSEIYQSLKIGVKTEKTILENTFEAFKPIFYVWWLKMINNLRSDRVG